MTLCSAGISEPLAVAAALHSPAAGDSLAQGAAVDAMVSLVCLHIITKAAVQPLYTCTSYKDTFRHSLNLAHNHPVGKYWKAN